MRHHRLGLDPQAVAGEAKAKDHGNEAELTLEAGADSNALLGALMERAAASGFMAANSLLATRGVRPEAVYTVPPRGLFAGVGR